MSQYADLTDVLAQGLPQKALNGIDVMVIPTALASASAFCDSYIGVRFGLPLISWGQDLRMVAAKVAIYNLIQLRGYSPQGTDVENIRLAYEDALQWLKDVAKGLATPVDVVATVPVATAQNSGVGQVYVAAPTQGRIGVGGGSMGDCGIPTNPQTPTSGRTRGW